MLRLIDVDEAKRRIVEFATGCHPQVLTVETIVKILDKTPTVDAAPVVHGRWITKYWSSGFIRSCTCSECRTTPKDIYNPDNYCPCCGAKMDGGNDDDRV